MVPNILENGARDRIRTGDLFVTNEVLYLLSYTGMVGMLGLEPRNPEGADLQSAAVAAVPHPHSVIKNSLRTNVPCKREKIVRLGQILVNVYHVSGRILSSISAHPQVRGAVEKP